MAQVARKNHLFFSNSRRSGPHRESRPCAAVNLTFRCCLWKRTEELFACIVVVSVSLPSDDLWRVRGGWRRKRWQSDDSRYSIGGGAGEAGGIWANRVNSGVSSSISNAFCALHDERGENACMDGSEQVNVPTHISPAVSHWGRSDAERYDTIFKHVPDVP